MHASSVQLFRSPQESSASCCCAASVVPLFEHPRKHSGCVHDASQVSTISAQVWVPPPSGGGLMIFAAWLIQPTKPTTIRRRHTG